MDREGGNRQRMRKSWEWISLSISSFSLHFLFISSCSLHFLAARLQGCNNLCNSDDITMAVNSRLFKLIFVWIDILSLCHTWCLLDYLLQDPWELVKVVLLQISDHICHKFPIIFVRPPNFLTPIIWTPCSLPLLNDLLPCRPEL